MMIRRCLQQMFRKPRVTIPYLVILCLLVAFLSMGLDLMSSGVQMAAKAEDAFDTIGVVEFFRDVPTDPDYYVMQAELDHGTLSEETYQAHYNPEQRNDNMTPSPPTTMEMPATPEISHASVRVTRRKLPA